MMTVKDELRNFIQSHPKLKPGKKLGKKLTLDHFRAWNKKLKFSARKPLKDKTLRNRLAELAAEERNVIEHRGGTHSGKYRIPKKRSSFKPKKPDWML